MKLINLLLTMTDSVEVVLKLIFIAQPNFCLKNNVTLLVLWYCVNIIMF